MHVPFMVIALIGGVMARPTSLRHPHPGRQDSDMAPGVGGPAARTLPNTVVVEGERMLSAFAAVSQGEYSAELNNILAQADMWLGLGPWTVTSKKIAVPEGSP